MLIEMSAGNFFYRIERSMENDTLDALVVALNMTAEEIQEALVHQSYVNMHTTIRHIVEMVFILNKEGIVRKVNKNVSALLHKDLKNVLDAPFQNLLEESSVETWQLAFEKLDSKTDSVAVNLAFVTGSDLRLPSACYITKLKGHKSKEIDEIIVTVVKHSSDQKELERDLRKKLTKVPYRKKDVGKKKAKPKLSYEDIQKIRKGHDYIRNNLKKDFPTLKEFALQLGTNEFKLKYGFKQLYGTSVYRFLKKERLRKAKMLVQFTDLPVKTVANMTGFKSLPHFSRAFHKRYGYSPTTYRKRANS